MGAHMAYKQTPTKNNWDKNKKTTYTNESENVKEKRKKESDRRRSKRKRDNYYDDED